jgi:hypothetical protein
LDSLPVSFSEQVNSDLCRRLKLQWGGATILLSNSNHNVLVRNVHGVGTCTPNTKHQFNPPFSTRDISTTMAPIDDALAAIEARELGEDIVY